MLFTGTLNLSAEPAGPLHVLYQAWDVPAGGTATINLQGEYTLFVGGTRPAIPTPAPATGLTLAFSDHFTTLSATPCKPDTGTWPNYTAPSASDGFQWYENLYNGQDFGYCANEHTDGLHNPFTILPQGYNCLGLYLMLSPLVRAPRLRRPKVGFDGRRTC